ncbi:unnamed protein product [Closterium sp. NIES-53]
MFPVHPARNLFSKYEIHEKLGSGRFGTVRRCTHRATDIEFACKRVAPLKEELRSAANEINALTLLHDCSHVTPLRDVFRDSEGALYLQSDLATGGDLVSWILKNGPLSECDAREVFRDIAAGVQECHERGILHRDVKPDNVLLFPRSPRGSRHDSESELEPSCTAGIVTIVSRLGPVNASESSSLSSTAQSSPSSPSSSSPSSASQSSCSSFTPPLTTDERGAGTPAANCGAPMRAGEHFLPVQTLCFSSTVCRTTVTVAETETASGLNEAPRCAFVAKLADFGGSTVLKPGQTATGYVGSMPYMAPEVAGRKPYGFPADVWSMGVTLYVILSGRWPTISRGRQSSRDWELPYWGLVSGRAKSLIRRMLSGDPQTRPSVARILQDAWLCGASAFELTRQTACITGMGSQLPHGPSTTLEKIPHPPRTAPRPSYSFGSHLLPCLQGA